MVDQMSPLCLSYMKIAQDGQADPRKQGLRESVREQQKWTNLVQFLQVGKVMWPPQSHHLKEFAQQQMLTANALVSYTITFGGRKRWTLIVLPAVWFYDSNQVSLLVHSEQVHKPNRAVFSSLQTTGPRKWENKWAQNLRVFLPCWTNGKIKLVHFHSVMLMILLNWLLWRKITANNLNFLLVSSPRYLTF